MKFYDSNIRGTTSGSVDLDYSVEFSGPNTLDSVLFTVSGTNAVFSGTFNHYIRDKDNSVHALVETAAITGSYMWYSPNYASYIPVHAANVLQFSGQLTGQFYLKFIHDGGE